MTGTTTPIIIIMLEMGMSMTKSMTKTARMPRANIRSQR
jgi:hypothetical protein